MGYAAAPRVAFIVHGIQTFLLLYNDNNYNDNVLTSEKAQNHERNNIFQQTRS